MVSAYHASNNWPPVVAVSGPDYGRTSAEQIVVGLYLLLMVMFQTLRSGSLGDRHR